MLYAARQSFHLDVAFMCHSVLSSARFLSKSLTLAHCLASWSPRQFKFRILQLLQNEYWAPLNVSDRSSLSIAVTFSILAFLSHLYCSLFLTLAPRLPFFTLLFSLAHFYLYVSFFPLALLSPDILNQGVIDNVSPSLSSSVNSLTLFCFSHCLLSVMSWAMQEAILSPQSPTCLQPDSHSHPRKDEIPEHSL